MLRWSPLYKHRLAQYCHSLHRLSDKHFWRSVEIFVHPTHIVYTQTTWHYKQQCYIWETSRGEGILSSRVIIAFIRADLRRLSLFCDRQDCWLTTHRHQNFRLRTLQLVPCVFTVLAFVLLWIYMFTDMILRNLWRKYFGYLVCHSLHGWNSFAGKSPYN